MTQHQDHLIVEDENGFYCKTCTDRDADRAELQREAELYITYYLNGVLSVDCGGEISQGQQCVTA